MSTLAYGTRVRFNTEALGTVDPAVSMHKFTDHTIGNGDEGTVVADALPEGWVAVAPDAWPDEIVLVHPDMIEAL